MIQPLFVVGHITLIIGSIINLFLVMAICMHLHHPLHQHHHHHQLYLIIASFIVISPSHHHFFHRHLIAVSPSSRCHLIYVSLSFSSHYHYSFRCLCSLFHHIHSHVWCTLANECGSGGAVVLWYEGISSFVLILS